MLRLDGSKEYGSNELLQFVVDNGIRLQVTLPYTSTKNSRVEVSNYIVYRIARAIIIYASLPIGLWNEAVAAVVYILNLILSDALSSKILRYKIDLALGRSINKAKLYLLLLRVYSATTVVYDYIVPRSSKFASKG